MEYAIYENKDQIIAEKQDIGNLKHMEKSIYNK